MTPDELAKLEAKLDSFRELKGDWDSYGALPVKPEAVAQAKHFIRRLLSYDYGLKGYDIPSPGSVSPSPDGDTIGFEWCFNGYDLEVESDTDGKMSYYLTTEPGDTELAQGETLFIEHILRLPIWRKRDG